jgi:hypothetical protein
LETLPQAFEYETGYMRGYGGTEVIMSLDLILKFALRPALNAAFGAPYRASAANQTSRNLLNRQAKAALSAELARQSLPIGYYADS